MNPKMLRAIKYELRFTVRFITVLREQGRHIVL